jgi:hypothetical protein
MVRDLSKLAPLTNAGMMLKIKMLKIKIGVIKILLFITPLVYSMI